MSALTVLLSALLEARAERVFFAPGEVGQAFEGDKSRPLPGGPLAANTLAAAVSEVLSNDDVHALPTSRPRIVRHEHDGVDFVIEIVRQSGGIAIGLRRAKATLRRDVTSEPAGDSLRDSVRNARLEPVGEPPPFETSRAPDARRESAGGEAPTPARPEDSLMRRASRRLRAAGRDKRTIRVELDDEGVPLDATAIDIDVQMPGEPAKLVAGPLKPTKPLAGPSAVPVTVPAPAPAPAPGAPRLHETLVIPRAGRPAMNTEIDGQPSGAYVTFLFAPGGFSLVTEHGTVVVSATHDAVIGGELYVGPSMKLRIAQGPTESLVSLYRFASATEAK